MRVATRREKRIAGMPAVVMVPISLAAYERPEPARAVRH